MGDPSRLGTDEALAARDFWVAYDAHHRDVGQAVRAAAEAQPACRLVAQALTPAPEPTPDAASDVYGWLQRGVLEGDWRPYEEHLANAAALSKGMGIAPLAWLELGTVFSRALLPRLCHAHAGEPERLAAAVLAMQRFLSRALAVVLSRAGTASPSAARGAASSGPTPALPGQLLHDLRAPLNAIIGFAELLHDGAAGQLTAEQLELVADILEGGRQLFKLINSSRGGDSRG